MKGSSWDVGGGRAEERRVGLEISFEGEIDRTMSPVSFSFRFTRTQSVFFLPMPPYPSCSYHHCLLQFLPCFLSIPHDNEEIEYLFYFWSL